MPDSNEDMLTLTEKLTNGSFLLRHHRWPHQSVRLPILCLKTRREEYKR